MFGSAQHAVMLVLSVAAFGAEVYALVDALRYSNEAYYAAGKRNKAFWTAILGAAATVGFLGLPAPLGRSATGPFGLISLAALVAAIVYIVDVRPAVSQHRRSRRGPRQSKGGW